MSIQAITEKTVIPLSLTLLLAIATGVWTLASKVSQWETRLQSIERHLTGRWTFTMERESWRETIRKNPTLVAPDVSAIRKDFLPWE